MKYMVSLHVKLIPVRLGKNKYCLIIPYIPLMSKGYSALQNI